MIILMPTRKGCLIKFGEEAVRESARGHGAPEPQEHITLKALERQIKRLQRWMRVTKRYAN